MLRYIVIMAVIVFLWTMANVALMWWAMMRYMRKFESKRNSIVREKETLEQFNREQGKRHGQLYT